MADSLFTVQLLLEYQELSLFVEIVA